MKGDVEDSKHGDQQSTSLTFLGHSASHAWHLL